MPVKLSERRSESTAQRAPLSRKIQRHAVIGQHGAAVNGGSRLVVKVGAIEDARWAVQRRLRVGGSYDEHQRRQTRVLRFSSFGEAVSLVLRNFLDRFIERVSQIKYMKKLLTGAVVSRLSTKVRRDPFLS